MKKLFIIYLTTVLSVLQLAAQVPQGINYQTVVRNSNGAIIPSQNVNFRLSIISGSPTGNIVYVEAHPVATNSLGLVNLIIGQGTPLSGTFSSINWGSASHYLSVELDPAGGTAFQPMGTSQLMSVPYALSAGNSSTSMAQLTDVTVTGVADGQTLKWNTAQSKWLPANDIGGGTGDNWGTQVVQKDNTLTGNGTSATPLKLAQQGATSGQVLKWNGTTWLPDNDIGGGAGDNWGTQTVQTDNTLTGNGTSATPLKLAQQSATNGQVLKWNGTAWLPAADANTDAQTLSIIGNSLSISGGNSVTLPSSGGSGWALTGNSGTSPSTNFIGTTDTSNLVFKVNNTKAGFISRSISGGLFFGINAGSQNVASNNIGFGGNALLQNTTGGGNTAFGVNSMRTNTTGYSNLALGENSLYSNTSGNNNVSVGTDALFSNTTGATNTAVGNSACGLNTVGTLNTAVGYLAIQENSTATGNTAVGAQALQKATAGYNTAVGGIALGSNITGERNTAVGLSSLSTLTSGSYNTGVGHSADVDNGSRTNCIVIAGNGNLTLGGDNRVRIGNSSMTSIGGQVAWTNLSDERIKQNVSSDVKGLAFIMKLNPVTYNYSVSKSEQLQGKKDTADWKGKYSIEKIRFSGFMAQQVDAAAKEAGYSFSGVDKPEDANGLWGLRYSEFTVPLVKAVQEQQALIEKLMKEIEYLKNKID